MSRGRPAGGSDARQRLVDAARKRFAAQGFSATSVRSIASDAGVDASLINHHFGGKEGLLAEALDLPFNPAERIADVVAGGPDGFGERLVRTFVTTWDPHRETFAMLARGGLGGEANAITDVARDVVAGRMTEFLGDRLRADLLVGMVIGLGLGRYVVPLEPLASAPVEDVVAAYGPAIQTLVP